MKGDAVLAVLESETYGVTTRKQLTKAGFTVKAIRYRVDAGRLQVQSRGVFLNPAVPQSTEQRIYIAVLAGGPTAFASHATGQWLWKQPFADEWAGIEVTTHLQHQPRTDGTRFHRSGRLEDADIRVVRGIPVSSPERTILDLSSRYSMEMLGKLVDDGLRRRITTLARLHHVAQLPFAPGRSPKKLQEVLAARIPGSESDLEDFVLAALRRYELPLPVRQHRVDIGGQTRRIDMCYADRLLAIEALGFEYHGMRNRFDDDALRGNELQLAGFRVLEFTSAFDDYTIAAQVSRALGLPIPTRLPPLSYSDWIRLCRTSPPGGEFGTNNR